eukprot:gene15008-17749_t
MCVALAYAATPAVSYTFSVPYVGAHQLGLSTTSGSIKVMSLIFESNAEIDGTPYGDLWNNNAVISSVPTGNNITYTYTVSWGSSGFSLTPGSSPSMTYGFSSNAGPLECGMNPILVQVTTSASSSPITATISGACRGNACNDPSPNYRIVGYYTDWDMYERDYLPANIPITMANEIHYAFINFDTAGNLDLYDTNSDPQQLPRLSVLRQQFPYLNIYLSIGGWTLSDDFSTVAASESATQNFATQCAQALIQTGFNGIDIDWEYPVVREGNPDDAKDFPNFLTAIRTALDAAAEEQSKATGTPVTYYLSIAGPAGIDKIDAVLATNPNGWTQVQEACHYVNIMAYDFHGSWDTISDFMAPLDISPNDPYINNATLGKYDTVDAVNMYLKLGFTKNQLTVGIPIYGRSSYVSTMGSTFGLWQPITGCPPGEFDATGLFDYRCIINNECYGTGLPAGTTIVQPANNPNANYAQGPIGYSAADNFFISFDDAQSVAIKAKYIAQQGLGGAMFWTFSGDVAITNPNSIIASIYNTLNPKA